MTDSWIIQFLKKESATIALMEMLHNFDIVNFSDNLFKKHDPLRLSKYDVKVFCTRWVKTKGEQRREIAKSNSGSRLD